MSHLGWSVRPFAMALALAFTTAPVIASAESDAKTPAAHASKHHFPMPAKTFRELVEKRIQHARTHLEKQLDAHKVDAAVQSGIKKQFEDGAKVVRQAAERVAADGTVTEPEAKDVKDVAKDMKRKAKAKLRAERRSRGLGRKAS